MTTYAGAIGSLVRLDYTSSQQIGDERAMSMATTLGGRRIAQLGAASRRQWSVSVPRTSVTGVARLQVLRQSVPMPWVWLPSWATRTNILTPDHSAWQGLSLTGATVGSLVDLDDGGIASSLNDPSGSARQFTLYYPVVPGVKVTGAVYARQLAGTSVTCRITWRDAAGATISSVTGTKAVATSGPLSRVTVSATPPSNAVTCYLVATNHSILAAPSITYTDVPVEWGPGAGCLTAVVAGLEQDVVTAFGTPGGQESTYNFTVSEVG